jgi:hypothetical protein
VRLARVPQRAVPGPRLAGRVDVHDGDLQRRVRDDPRLVTVGLDLDGLTVQVSPTTSALVALAQPGDVVGDGAVGVVAGLVR